MALRHGCKRDGLLRAQAEAAALHHAQPHRQVREAVLQFLADLLGPQLRGAVLAFFAVSTDQHDAGQLGLYQGRGMAHAGFLGVF